MRIVRKLYSDKKEKLTPEQKQALAKSGIEAGATMTGLGAIGYGAAKLGKNLNEMRPGKEVVAKVANKIVDKKLKKKGLDDPQLRERMLDAVYKKMNTLGVPEKTITNAKLAGKGLMVVGVPLTAYSVYKHKKLKKKNEDPKK